jgi:pimeloyl-ACP methyl ester carboxylesterase
MKVYFIPGLGADKRVFRHISLPETCEAVYLEWLKPEKRESLEKYSIRMSQQIQSDEPFYVLGLSLGGMIAAEITRLFPQAKLILIASIPHAGHLPSYYRWIQKARLQKVVPITVIKTFVYMRRYFSAETEVDKNLIRSMARDADPSFIRWAMNAALEWRGYEYLKDIVHIHGTNDIVLPVKYTRPTHIILNGSHLMIMDRAEEINKILGDVMGVEIENRK